jgi:hypothetical protein
MAVLTAEQQAYQQASARLYQARYDKCLQPWDRRRVRAARPGRVPWAVFPLRPRCDVLGHASPWVVVFERRS